MKQPIKPTRYSEKLNVIPEIFRKNRNFSIGFLMLLLFIAGLACSKSSSSKPVPPPPPPCTTDACKLTGYKWEIAAQKISTDIGVYNAQLSNLSTINWASFLFKPDSTYLTYGGETGAYSFVPATKKLVIVDNLLPLDFNLNFPAQTTVTFTGDTMHMHPRTDFSVAANFSINSIAGDLYTNYGVDTSKIHYMVVVFTYNGF